MCIWFDRLLANGLALFAERIGYKSARTHTHIYISTSVLFLPLHLNFFNVLIIAQYLPSVLWEWVNFKVNAMFAGHHVIMHICKTYCRIICKIYRAPVIIILQPVVIMLINMRLKSLFIKDNFHLDLWQVNYYCQCAQHKTHLTEHGHQLLDMESVKTCIKFKKL